MANVNDNFFDSGYKEIWRTLIPDVLTEREISFMLPAFNLQPGSKVLDIMCGYGRHTLALARKGIHVTAVDNLTAYINEIKDVAEKENLPVNTVCRSVVDFEPDPGFDLAICMGNSFNFFNAADAAKILRHVANGLKNGGYFLINTWSIAEIVFRNFKESSEGPIGEFNMSSSLQIYFQPTRAEAESVFTAADGSKEIKKGVDYIYSLNEMETMLNTAGFVLKEIYSIPGKKKFTLGEPRAYLVSQKR